MSVYESALPPALLARASPRGREFAWRLADIPRGHRDRAQRRIGQYWRPAAVPVSGWRHLRMLLGRGRHLQIGAERAAVAGSCVSDRPGRFGGFRPTAIAI